MERINPLYVLDQDPMALSLIISLITSMIFFLSETSFFVFRMFWVETFCC